MISFQRFCENKKESLIQQLNSEQKLKFMQFCLGVVHPYCSNEEIEHLQQIHKLLKQKPISLEDAAEIMSHLSTSMENPTLVFMIILSNILYDSPLDELSEIITKILHKNGNKTDFVKVADAVLKEILNKQNNHALDKIAKEIQDSLNKINIPELIPIVQKIKNIDITMLKFTDGPYIQELMDELEEFLKNYFVKNKKFLDYGLKSYVEDYKKTNNSVAYLLHILNFIIDDILLNFSNDVNNKWQHTVSLLRKLNV